MGITMFIKASAVGFGLSLCFGIVVLSYTSLHVSTVYSIDP